LIEVDRCLICEGPLRNERLGTVAPFLAQRIWQRKPFSVRLAECSDCGFIFFNPRLEAFEEVRLYSGYRGVEYQRMRHSFEPWYTEAFNASLSSKEAWLHRKQSLTSLFRDQLNFGFRTFGDILDFGGDNGDLIADLVPATRRFVYEISGVETVAGVEPLRSLEKCREHSFDLIVSSNVLEHVGSPHEVARQIASLSGSETLVFNEVPYEFATGVQSTLKRIAQMALLAGTRPAVAGSMLGPGMFNVMHEHVNYYSPRSFNRLMERSGFKVVASGIYTLKGGLLGERFVWNLAKRA
jgi:hypothetical protein